jgi:endonuclease/exonuclease/phosphatase family metal-dependent hydrolase
VSLPKPARRALKVVLVVLAILVAVVGGYLAYLVLTYSRIPDGQELSVDNAQAGVARQQLDPQATYSISTYNIGFGAYTPDYTFFMDEGVMADGTPTKGTHGVAASKESVEACTEGDIQAIRSLGCDFSLWQEVDVDSDRSYHVNQLQAIEAAFADRSGAFASNFHSAFLAYPWPEMHGRVSAGILALGDVSVSSAVRRSYPVDGSFPTRFFDLDRCFEVLRIPVSNGRDLVLINSHMSAYDAGGTIRQQQLTMLDGVMAEEYAKGNYVIAGGDWNQALCGSIELYPSQQQVPSWVHALDDSDLPAGFSAVRADNLAEVATCRGDDIPYERDVTYTTTIDGFIVSPNVTASARNVDLGFAYSDHNPVEMSFSLDG